MSKDLIHCTESICSILAIVPSHGSLSRVPSHIFYVIPPWFSSWPETQLVVEHGLPHRTITRYSRWTIRSIRPHFAYESTSVLLPLCSFVYLGNNFGLKCITRSTLFPFYWCDSIYFNRSYIRVLYHLFCFLFIASRGCLSVTFRPTVTSLVSVMLFHRLARPIRSLA